MNITFAFPAPSLNGGCRVVAIYAQMLVNAGHHVTIVCPGFKFGGVVTSFKRLLRGGITTEKRLKNSHFSELKGVEVQFVSPDRINDSRFYPDADVLVATWWKTAEWISGFPPSKGKKAYFVQHYEAHQEQPLERVINTYRADFPKIVIAEWIADVMEKKYGDSDTILVPNAVDKNQFFREPKPEPENRVTVCAMYSRSEFKGMDITFSAFRKLRKDNEDAKLILFGAKPVAPDIDLPQGAEFVLAPSKSELRRIYSTSRAYIFSSRSEGFGLPILEALACGCPVVATKAGCAPSYITDGVNGYLSDIDDAESQANGIRSILALSDSSWSEMSAAAMRSVENSSWESSYRKFENALIKISKNNQLVSPVS